MEREFEREILDHAAFLREEIRAWELEAELEEELPIGYHDGCPPGWESV